MDPKDLNIDDEMCKSSNYFIFIFFIHYKINITALFKLSL